jgi:hypothetical protein
VARLRAAGPVHAAPATWTRAAALLLQGLKQGAAR